MLDWVKLNAYATQKEKFDYIDILALCKLKAARFSGKITYHGL